MRRYLLDTGVLVHYARQSALYQQIEQTEKLSEQDCLPMISVVTYGEILSFALQHGWGQKKIQSVQSWLNKLIIIDINSGDPELLRIYAEMDAFSKNKLPEKKLKRSISIGKNDLWIAATAKVADATLITIDGDFDHLNGEFITVKKYSPT